MSSLCVFTLQSEMVNRQQIRVPAFQTVTRCLCLHLCRVWRCLVSRQLSVTSFAAYWFLTSHRHLSGTTLKKSQDGEAGLGPLKAHLGALSQVLSCGTWSARILWKHITSLTALGEDTTSVCSHLVFVFQKNVSDFILFLS